MMLSDENLLDNSKGSSSFKVERWKSGSYESASDQIAEEIPIAFMYNGIPYAVMLATPTDIKDFAIGFTLSEEIVVAPNEIHKLDIQQHENGIELHITIPRENAIGLQERTRNIAGCTGCGICGTTSLDGAIRHPSIVGPGVSIDADVLHHGLESIMQLQSLNILTGAVHAACWLDLSGDILLMREDVGRHNALDKLIGAIKTAETTINLDRGFLIITSRASFEMVQKAALAGICFMAAISAPTALAIRLATECELTLVGFAREHSHVVYNCGDRIKK